MNIYDFFKFCTLISQYGDTSWAIHLHDICHGSVGRAGKETIFKKSSKLFNLISKVISGRNKISSLFIMKSLFNVSSCTWSTFISHVVCLDKTSNSWYNYSGPFLGQKFCGIRNVFKIQFFPLENILLPILW